MPDPFNKAKMTGDTHPPEVESDLPLEEGSSDAAGISGTPTDRGRVVDSGSQDRPGRGVKKGELLQDEDDGESPGNRSDTGRGAGGNRA